MTGHLLRMVWPITDNTQGLPDLLDVACPEVPALATQAHARITGAVRFTVCRSVDVPGSGRTTEFVLVGHAPAEPRTPRPYRIQP